MHSAGPTAAAAPTTLDSRCHLGYLVVVKPSEQLLARLVTATRTHATTNNIMRLLPVLIVDPFTYLALVSIVLDTRARNFSTTTSQGRQ